MKRCCARGAVRGNPVDVVAEVLPKQPSKAARVRHHPSVPSHLVPAALKDDAESRYLKELPTSFVLPPESVDRVRAAAGTIIASSPAFQRLLKDVGATILPEPAATATAAVPK